MKKLSVLLAAFLIPAMSLPGCAPARPDCSSPEIFCVGLVTDIGKINDRGFNQSAWKGVQQAEEELGALIQYVETGDTRDYPKNIATFADEDFDVIVTVGFGLREATWAAAEMYPDVRFIGVDQDQSEGILENVAGLVFPEDEAGFLVGALAAMMSETHKVGAVCASDDIPPVWRLGEGYRAGAAYTDEQLEMSTDVIVLYHNDVSFDTTFVDPEWGAASAEAMAKEGVDVVFGCGGVTGNGAIIHAAQAGLYVIGVDTDQYLTLPEAAPRMLSSAMKLITPGVFELLQSARNGSFPSGNYVGAVTYAPFHDLANQVPSEVQAAMEQINAGLLDGSIDTHVPSEKP
jgi:basic membrane protein A